MRRKRKSIPRTASLLIEADGVTSAAFLWDDLFGKDSGAPEIAATEGSLAFPVTEYEACRCCPKQCGFDRARKAHPTCGDLRLRVASYGVTLGDEPAIAGLRGSGAIMLSGCPLRCPSCHSLEMVEDGTPVSIEELLSICEELRLAGAHNIQILSPTCHLPALRVALRELRERRFPLPIVWKSSGYESVEELKKLEGLVDVYLPDFKFGPCSSWAGKAGAKNYFDVASAAILEMIRQAGPLVTGPDGTAARGTLVRHVMAPLPERERRDIAAFLESLPEGVVVSRLEKFQLLDEFSINEAAKSSSR